jgi:hypothetical protein
MHVGFLGGLFTFEGSWLSGIWRYLAGEGEASE